MPLSEQATYAISFWAGMLWLLVFVMALICVRTKALWLLIGAPFALWAPFVLVTIYAMCSINVYDCP